MAAGVSSVRAGSSLVQRSPCSLAASIILRVSIWYWLPPSGSDVLSPPFEFFGRDGFKVVNGRVVGAAVGSPADTDSSPFPADDS